MARKVTFEAWLAKVDAAIRAKTGLTLRDLDDCPYADWYEDGVSPATAAKRAIKNAGGDF